MIFVLALTDTLLFAAIGRCTPAPVAEDDLIAANALRSGVRELGRCWARRWPDCCSRLAR